MNPVVGLDVAKGESQVQAFLDRKQPYKKSFKISHTVEGLKQLHHFLKDIEGQTSSKPAVIMESTGHYQSSIIQFLDEHHYLSIVVNPLLSYKARTSSLRKVKTDAIDAYLLCEMYYKEELEPYKKRGIQLLNLRNLTRQHEQITNLSSQNKQQFQTLLDQVFPEYKGVFGDLCSDVSLLVLLEYPTSSCVLLADEKTLSDRIHTLCQSRSQSWAKEKANLFIKAAVRNPFQENLYFSLITSMKMHIQMVLQYKEHLSNLKNEIDALVKDIEEYKIILSIPGIGEKIAASIRFFQKSER